MVQLKKTNRVFLLVIVLLSFVVMTAWQAIQTDRFGEILSDRVSLFARDKFDIDVKFERLQFRLIPFTTELVNLELQGESVELSAAKIALSFGFRDLFSNEFSVGKLLLEDSFLKLKLKSKREQKTDWKDLFKLYQKDIYRALPFRLRSISLKNTEVEWGEGSLEVLRLKSNLYPNLLTTEFDLSFSDSIKKRINKEIGAKVSFDGITGEIQLSKDYIRMKNTRFLSENSFLGLSGKVMFSEVINDLSFECFFDLDKIRGLVRSQKINKKIIPTGALEIKGVIKGSMSDFEAQASVLGFGLKSPFYRIREVEGELFLKDGVMRAENFSGKIGVGSIQTVGSVDLISFPEGKFLMPTFGLRTEGIYSNDLLFFIEALDKAKFFLSGESEIKFLEKAVIVRPKEGLQLEKFRLLNDQQKSILQNPLVSIPQGGSLELRYDGSVLPDLRLNFPNSSIKLKGFVDGKRVDVSLDGSKVDFVHFGPIIDLSVKGEGDASGSIKGPLNNVVMNFNLDQKNFEILGFKLDDVKGDIRYDLKRAKLSLANVQGLHRSLSYAASGSINFDNRKDALDMNISILKGNLLDTKYVMAPILSPLEDLLTDVRFAYTSSINLTGGLKVPLMRVEGEISAKSLLMKSEDLDELTADFSLVQEKLTFSKIKGKKVTGRVTGNADVHLVTKDFNYKGSFSGLRLKDFFYYRFLNLGFDGDAFGEFYGVGNPTSFSTRSHLRVTGSSIENVRLEDSVLTVYNNKDDLFFSGSLIGGEASVEGYLNLGQELKKRSSFSARVKTDDLKVLSGFLGKHNITNNRIRGKLNLSMQTDFHLKDPSSLNLKGVVRDLEFEYPGIDIEPIKKPIIVEVEDGALKNWSYEVSGKGFELTSLGKGDLRSQFSLSHDFKVDSSLFELVTDRVKKSSGMVAGNYLILGKNNSLSHFLSLKAKSLAFKVKDLPGLFSNFNLDLNLDNNLVRINSAGGEYGNGSVFTDGTVRLKFPFPEVKLDVNIERSRFPLFKKSGVVVSGDLQLRGKELPYDLKGNLAIIQGEVVEEMSDLASSAINNDSYQRFIPVGFLEGNVSFINSDIGITSFSPIKIRNGLIDVGLGGNLKIFGSVSSPRINGELDIQNQENKFLFKGHEFILNEGVIRFIDQARKESPELRFSGVARINEYDVYISLNGPADNLAVDMSSNPPLVQEDILSLLTLGVTNDVSRNLGDRQRQSVTTLSIGSLIMDQLKINQSLNDSLGLRLSVQPDFVEDENNLLEGRVEDSGTGNRFRSSTVVKVQKKISRKVNLSVSSTLGGSVDQSQQMNVNYKINKSWSLEGVYEVRSNDELEQELPDSAGADIKFQWSF